MMVDYESPAAEPPSSDTNDSGQERTGPGQDIDAKVAVLLSCCAVSIIELGSAADMMNAHGLSHSKVVFSVVLGSLSLVLCLLRLVIFRFNKNAFAFVDIYLATLLSIGWACGAALLTSKGGPFSVTNNGYFSTWLALIATLYYAFLSSEARMRHKFNDEIARQNGNLVVVFVASLIELAVASDHCEGKECTQNAVKDECSSKCTPQESLAIAMGVLSVIFVGIHLVMTRFQHHFRDSYEVILAPCLVVLWSVASGVNTSSRGPFPSSCDYANGYFATWVAFFATLKFAWSVLLAHIDGGDRDADDEDLEENLMPSGGEMYAPLESRK
eukprot:m.23271 g.23271  ORF g.23271 m.23271 type:complete len:328 (+) comp7482_c0_seq2:153-1136(+)